MNLTRGRTEEMHLRTARNNKAALSKRYLAAPAPPHSKSIAHQFYDGIMIPV